MKKINTIIMFLCCTLLLSGFTPISTGLSDDLSKDEESPHLNNSFDFNEKVRNILEKMRIVITKDNELYSTSNQVHYKLTKNSEFIPTEIRIIDEENILNINRILIDLDQEIISDIKENFLIYKSQEFSEKYLAKVYIEIDHPKYDKERKALNDLFNLNSSPRMGCSYPFKCWDVFVDLAYVRSNEIMLMNGGNIYDFSAIANRILSTIGSIGGSIVATNVGTLAYNAYNVLYGILTPIEISGYLNWTLSMWVWFRRTKQYTHVRNLTTNIEIIGWTSERIEAQYHTIYSSPYSGTKSKRSSWSYYTSPNYVNPYQLAIHASNGVIEPGNEYHNRITVNGVGINLP